MKTLRRTIMLTSLALRLSACGAELPETVERGSSSGSTSATTGTSVGSTTTTTSSSSSSSSSTTGGVGGHHGSTSSSSSGGGTTTGGSTVCVVPNGPIPCTSQQNCASDPSSGDAYCTPLSCFGDGLCHPMTMQCCGVDCGGVNNAAQQCATLDEICCFGCIKGYQEGTCAPAN